jgi:hypothetical protein
MTKQPTQLATRKTEQSYEQTMHILPPYVYEHIVEACQACRPFYAIEQQAGDGKETSGSVQLPMRFEDSVALSKAQKNLSKIRLVSPSPEVLIPCYAMSCKRLVAI